MAEKRFSKGSEEWLLFMDFWNLCQKFWVPEDTEGYWEAVISETDEFYKKYRTGFARRLVVVLIGNLESKMREERENGSTDEK